MEAERRDFPGAMWLRELKSAESGKTMSEGAFGEIRGLEFLVRFGSKSQIEEGEQGNKRARQWVLSWSLTDRSGRGVHKWTGRLG